MQVGLGWKKAGKRGRRRRRCKQRSLEEHEEQQRPGGWAKGWGRASPLLESSVKKWLSLPRGQG